MAVPDKGVYPCVWQYLTEVCIRGCGSAKQRFASVCVMHTEVCIRECGSNRQGSPVVQCSGTRQRSASVGVAAPDERQGYTWLWYSTGQGCACMGVAVPDRRGVVIPETGEHAWVWQ